MRSTRTGTTVHPFLGADLTDRYAKGCKPVDVCGLSPGADSTLLAAFWTWEWDPAGRPVQVGPLLHELSDGVSAMMDGPQGLAERPATMRLCERRVGAVGKTPFKRMTETKGRPFAGFVLSGLDLFDALERAGVRLASSDDPAGLVGEVYPGDLWPLLARPGLVAGSVLPKKIRSQGWLIRKALLEAVGVRFGPSLEEGNHDQLDACLGAVVAAGRSGRVPGLETTTVGQSIYRDSGGDLREGEMFRLEVAGDRLRDVVRTALRPFAADLVAVARGRSPRGANAPSRPRQDATRRAAARAWAGSALSWINGCKALAPADRVVALLSWLVDAAKADCGGPVLLGYGAAWRMILPNRPYPSNRGPNAWKEAIHLAAATPAQALEGFGAVRLDTFLVAVRPKTPGNGHWATAEYDKEDWLRVFGDTALITAQDVAGEAGE